MCVDIVLQILSKCMRMLGTFFICNCDAFVLKTSESSVLAFPRQLCLRLQKGQAKKGTKKAQPPQREGPREGPVPDGWRTPEIRALEVRSVLE